jgi:hypothetical protein
MALSHSSKIVTDGLVLYFDQNNVQKSWKGAPATNLFTVTDLNNWSKSATVSTVQTLTPFNTPAYSVTDDNNTNYESIDRNITVANDSSSYTISLFVRKTYGATSARLGFNSGFNTGGTTVAYNQRFNSDTGVATVGTVIDYGDWWYWYFTVTNNGTGNTNFYCVFYPATGPYNSSDNSTATGTAIVGAFMLVAGSTAVRFADGTRSNTQALLDLTGRNTITVAGLTYASNGSFSFDGVDDYLDCGTTQQLTNNFTLEVWHNNINTGHIIDQGNLGTDPNGSLEYSNRGLTLGLNNLETVTATGTITNTAGWNSVTCSFASGSVNFYINGVFDSTKTMTNTAFLPSGILKIGRRALNTTVIMSGTLSVVKIYNKVLSADEVAQNFNALRGRYGI